MATATSLPSPEDCLREAVPASVSSVVGRMMSASSVMGTALSSAMVCPAKVTASAAGVRPLPPQTRARAGFHEAQHLLAHGGALGIGERMQHVALGAPEPALVRLGHAVALGRHLHHGLFLGEQDPVAVLLGQLPPGGVDVVAQVGQDVAQVLALPGPGPGGDGAVADAQRGVRDQGGLGDGVRDPQAVALGAGAGGRVRGKRVRVQRAGAVRIAAGAGEEHAQRVGQRGEGAHRGARTRRAAALLERDGGRQPGDHFHLGVVPLLDEPAGVGGHGFEVAALRLGIDGAEREGGLAGAGDAGEGDDRIAGHVHVHVAQVVLAGAAHPDKTVRRIAGTRSD